MPERREVLKRLATVNSSQHVAEYLHSQIADYSSRNIAAPGIVAMFASEIEAYCVQSQNRTMATTLTMLVPAYIRVLVHDQEVQEEALRIFKQVDR